MVLPAVAMSRRNANAYPASPKLRNNFACLLGMREKRSRRVIVVLFSIYKGFDAR